MNIAIVGTNFISDRLVNAARESSGVKISAVFSRKLDTGRAFADSHGIESVYTDYSEMLSDGRIDAVYIASPNVCHAAQAIAAMRAGKHVLCEKMMAVTTAELEEMSAVSQETGRVLLEAMRPAHNPIYDRVRELMTEIGAIRRSHFEYCQYSSRYDRFKAGIMTNAFDPTMYNSALADIGIYPLHMTLSLFGEPEDVAARSLFLENGFECAGNILLSYPKMTAEVVYSKITDGVNPSVIEGELGSILIDKISAPERVVVIYRSGSTREITADARDDMTYELDAFRRMTEGELDYRSYLADTARTTKIIDRTHTLTGAWRRMPPIPEKA